MELISGFQLFQMIKFHQKVVSPFVSVKIDDKLIDLYALFILVSVDVSVIARPQKMPLKRGWSYGAKLRLKYQSELYPYLAF